MDSLIDNIISWIQKSDKNVMIGISGHGAAGKSTFAQLLMTKLNLEANYLNTDPYIVSSNIRKYALIEYTYNETKHRHKMTACHPTAHHTPSLERDIRMLKEGMNIRTLDKDYSPSEVLSAQNKVNIIEGMTVAFVDPSSFDLLIYFYTDAETELNRRFSRDVTERGSKVEYLLQSHDERRIQYELFMHQYSEHFDIIIKSMTDKSIVEKQTFDFL